MCRGCGCQCMWCRLLCLQLGLQTFGSRPLARVDLSRQGRSIEVATTSRSEARLSPVSTPTYSFFLLAITISGAVAGGCAVESQNSRRAGSAAPQPQGSAVFS